MLEILAHVSILALPFLSGILSLVFMMVVGLLQVLGFSKQFIFHLSNFIANATLIYLLYFLFGKVGVEFNWVTAALIFCVLLINNIWRIKNRPDTKLETTSMIVDLLSVILISIYLI